MEKYKTTQETKSDRLKSLWIAYFKIADSKYFRLIVLWTFESESLFNRQFDPGMINLLLCWIIFTLLPFVKFFFTNVNRNFTIEINNSQNVSWRFKFYGLCTENELGNLQEICQTERSWLSASFSLADFLPLAIGAWSPKWCRHPAKVWQLDARTLWARNATIASEQTAEFVFRVSLKGGALSSIFKKSIGSCLESIFSKYYDSTLNIVTPTVRTRCGRCGCDLARDAQQMFLALFMPVRPF